MPQFSLNELAQDAGGATINFGKSLARNARNFTCGLYKDYTGWSIGQAQQGTIGGAYLKGVYDSICKDSPSGLPPSTPPPNASGCAGNWSVVIRYSDPGNNTNCPGVPHTTYVVAGTSGDPAILHSVTASGCGSGKEWFIGGTISTARTRVACDCIPNIVSRTFTNTDPNCVPNNPNNPPPANRITNNITINNNDGTSFNMPISYVEVSPNLDIVVDVGGIKLNLNVDGVKFDFSNRSTSYGDLFDVINNAGDTTNETINNNITNLGDNIANLGDNITTIGDTLIDINDKIEEFTDCCVEEKAPNPDDYDKVVVGIKNSDTVDSIVDLAYVELHISNFNNIGKIQSGLNSPNVIYSGWIEFRTDGNNLLREPIHFEHCLFKAPPHANGYAYCCTYGSRANAIYYTKKV